MKEKSQEKDPLDPQTVFKATHAEIEARGTSQCEMGKHKFQKHSENEVFCPVCQSIYIVKDVNKFI
jgi:Zn finger protein HypA/HybF involved in hydrogenase expression